MSTIDDDDDDDDDPFSCFGSSDSDDSNNTTDDDAQENSSRGRRLQIAANARIHEENTILTTVPLDTGSSKFEVFDENPNRGKGLRALQPYKCGDEILREGAAMRVRSIYAAHTRAEAEKKFENSVQSKFDALPKATQNSIMDLSCCSQYRKEEEDAPPLVGIYQTNSFQLGGNNESGLFLTVARINHSCRPNASHFWRSDLQQTLVFCSRDIHVGEEICTTYGPSESMTTKGRRKYLNDRFSFHCMCEMCREGNTMGGDDRMVELNSLYEDISLLLVGEPEEAIQAVNKCLELLKEAGIGGGAFTKPILHYGYQISKLRNEDEMARCYLERELVAVKNSEGAGSNRAVDIQNVLDGMNGR